MKQLSIPATVRLLDQLRADAREIKEGSTIPRMRAYFQGCEMAYSVALMYLTGEKPSDVCTCENQRALMPGEDCENCGGVAR